MDGYLQVEWTFCSPDLPDDEVGQFLKYVSSPGGHQQPVWSHVTNLRFPPLLTSTVERTNITNDEALRLQDYLYDLNRDVTQTPKLSTSLQRPSFSGMNSSDLQTRNAFKSVPLMDSELPIHTSHSPDRASIPGSQDIPHQNTLQLLEPDVSTCHLSDDSLNSSVSSDGHPDEDIGSKSNQRYQLLTSNETLVEAGEGRLSSVRLATISVHTTSDGQKPPKRHDHGDSGSCLNDEAQVEDACVFGDPTKAVPTDGKKSYTGWDFSAASRTSTAVQHSLDDELMHTLGRSATRSSLGHEVPADEQEQEIIQTVKPRPAMRLSKSQGEQFTSGEGNTGTRSAPTLPLTKK